MHQLCYHQRQATPQTALGESLFTTHGFMFPVLPRQGCIGHCIWMSRLQCLVWRAGFNRGSCMMSCSTSLVRQGQR